MSRVKRSLFRLTQIFDYRTFAVAGAFISVIIAGALVISSAQTAREGARTAQHALNAQDASRKAATRRIDLLSRDAASRDRQIQSLIATVSRQQTTVDALSEQIRQMGGKPVVFVRSGKTTPAATSSPAPQASTAPRPAPAPKPTPPSSPRPSPSPSPTCRPLPILGCRGAR